MSFDIDSELRTQTAQQLRQEKQGIASQLLHVQQQISDLAYGNYRTYADAGSTTEYCRKKFDEAKGKVDAIDAEVAELRGCLKEFATKSEQINKELDYLKSAESKSSPLWDILSLPTRMDVCIRAGYYEVAYSLTNYGIQLQQHGLTKNPAIKAVADKLIDARHYLLDELFNRFAGPIDLASSIQVVNSIRKMPCLSATQLRVSILQYRDLYLEKQIMDIRMQPDFVLRMVEVYRDCMYDTMVLYLAVFPEGEIIRRDPSIDPRWDVWQPCGPSAVLSEWAIHNLNVMFDYIRKVEDKSSVDVGVLSSKLMSFAMSFGRMGLDFRPLIANVLNDFVVSRFSSRVSDASSKLAESESLRIEGDVPEVPSVAHYASGVQPPPPSLLSMWDDICVYGNEVLDAMNELRNGLSPMHIGKILAALGSSLKAVFTWLNCFADRVDQQDSFAKAVKLLTCHFVPYINRCLLVLFPYEKCCRPFYHTAFTLEQYENRCALQIADLYAHCSHSTKFEQLTQPIKNLEKERDELETNVNTNILREDTITSSEPEKDGDGGRERRQSEMAVAEKHILDSTPAEVSDEVDFTVRASVRDRDETFSEITLKDSAEC
uniref:Conserved oligomeric Golgi complex subunit 8 n=1 Tax=Ascaris suum TaxID=6253 RepID=F1L1L0_ASCSU